MSTTAKSMASASYDVARIREDFPILHQEVHGKPLVYLDNGATAQKPRCVIEAISHYYQHDNANVHRGVHTLSGRATDSYEHAREQVRKFLNADKAKEIIFLRGTTEAINLVAQAYARPTLKPGDEILVTEMEHHSNIVPWQLLAKQTGAELKFIPINERGELVLEQLSELLTDKTKIFAFTHISNALGTINPVKELCATAKAVGAITVVDGAQAAPHAEIDVQDIGCDFYAISAHKVYGPTGIGALYGRFDLLQAMDPYQGGGEMIRKVTFGDTLFAEPPAKFEAGTPHIAGAIGFGCALEYITEIGLDRIAKHEHELLEYANKRIAEVPGIRLLGTAKQKAALLTFVIEGVHAHDVGTIMDHQGIAIRAGHHCAMPVMQHYKVAASVRASFGLYNTPQEVDAFIEGIKKVTEVMGR